MPLLTLFALFVQNLDWISCRHWPCCWCNMWAESIHTWWESHHLLIKFNLIYSKKSKSILSWLDPHPHLLTEKEKESALHRLKLIVLILIFTLLILLVTITTNLRFALASLEQCSSSLSALKETSMPATGQLWWVQPRISWNGIIKASQLWWKHLIMTYNIVL